jgi:circadian clock protein KaiC
MKINGRGITVGDPLMEFEGVLSGTPVYTGGPTPLLKGPGGTNEP